MRLHQGLLMPESNCLSSSIGELAPPVEVTVTPPAPASVRDPLLVVRSEAAAASKVTAADAFTSRAADARVTVCPVPLRD